ncbi:MAG: hypothetical protein ACTSYX_12255 [Candidatus Thorarchaeota archaeon]
MRFVGKRAVGMMLLGKSTGAIESARRADSTMQVQLLVELAEGECQHSKKPDQVDLRRARTAGTAVQLSIHHAKQKAGFSCEREVYI